MSEIEISQLLAQMRAMSALAEGRGETIGSTAGGSRPDFADLLANSVSAVNATQQHADKMAEAFQTGDPGVDLSEVMVALQKANLSFQAMTQVRNKLVSAYQEVMNMGI